LFYGYFAVVINFGSFLNDNPSTFVLILARSLGTIIPEATFYMKRIKKIKKDLFLLKTDELEIKKICLAFSRIRR
jgi:hypothetical protein